MPIIYSYPPIGNLSAKDRFIVSKEKPEDGNPTRSISAADLAAYIAPLIPTPANMVTGSGTTDRLTKWQAPVGSGVIEDSGIEDTGSEINVPYKLNIKNATSSADGIVFSHPAGGASGIVNIYYSGLAAGSRFVISRAATGGAEIELESDGDINLNRTGNGGVLIGGLGNYANDAAAAAGGVPINGLYRNGNNIQIRIV